MIHTAPVDVISVDVSLCVDACPVRALDEASARPRNFELSDGAVRRAHSAVIHLRTGEAVARVDIVKRDRPLRVEGVRPRCRWILGDRM